MSTLILPYPSTHPDLCHGKYVAGLFANGEQGVWYDPSDLSTMYQDAIGTIPVTAVGQPVGLILDKSKGAIRGPELLNANLLYSGTLNSGWSYQNLTFTAASVVPNYSYPTNSGGMQLPIPGVALNKFYEVRFSIAATSGNMGIAIGDSNVNSTFGFRGSGSYRIISRITSFSGIVVQVGSAFSGSITIESVREVLGNHATQSTTASRPTLSARVNLLTKTEQFNDAAWLKTNATIAANAVVAPDGTTTADTFIPGAGTVFGLASGAYFNSLNYFSQGVSVAAATYKYRLRVKDAGYDMAQLRVSESSSLSGTNQAVTRVLLSNGAVLTQSGTGNLTNVTAACTRTDDGWCDITLTFTSGAAQTIYFGILAWNTTAITSDGVKGLHIWGADLRVANESANLPSYQRVNTDTDYDTAGFPYYLLFDGVDDYLSTGSIDFTATDKMTVLTADHSAWDNVTRGITGLSSSVFGYDGTFWLTSYDYNYNAKSAAYLRGNLRGGAVYGPDQRTLGVRRLVRSFRFDISKDVLANETLIRLNGVPTPLAGTPLDPSAGSGNFGNWPLYIGRVGSQCPFSGRLYGLIVRGAATDDSHLTHAEKYLAYKSGVSL